MHLIDYCNDLATQRFIKTDLFPMSNLLIE